jgi:LCP family protein required for cell wall assembly
VTTPLASTHSHRRPRWPRVLKWTAITLAGVLVIGGAGSYLLYRHLFDQIVKAPIVTVDPPPPKIVANAENFLLMGSDSRAGASGKGTGGSNVQGARSDTTILLHLSAGDRQATLVSIPRDSYVQIPACVIGPNGQKSQPTVSKFNEAFSIGAVAGPKYAPSCAIATFESLTHVHIDHYAVINFAGFENVVDKLGGVRMCVAQPLVDPIVHLADGYHGSGLNLPAGKSVEIDGTQALALMRARYNLDGGGDLPRIKRQQEFIGAVIRKAFSTGLLLDPIKLYKVLNAATRSLQTDGFGVNQMRKLAHAIHSVGAGGIDLLTVPLDTTLPPGVPTADVAWDPVKSAELWNSIRRDQPVPGTVKATPTPTPTPSPTGPKLTVPPASIDVIVQNGTSQNGLGHTVANALAAKGFHIVSVGDASKHTYTSTVVEYSSEKVQSSQTVKASLPGSTRKSDLTAGSTITVIVGSDFTKVAPVTITSSTPTPTPTASLHVTTAGKEGCLS